MTDKTENELILAPGVTLAEVFTAPDSFEKVVAAIEAEAFAEPADTSTAKGRDKIKSRAYDVAQKKVAIDKRGKELTEDARAHIEAVNATRNKFKERLTDIQAKVRKPVEDWETADAERVDTIKKLIAANFRPAAFYDDVLSLNSETIGAMISRAESCEVDARFDEYISQAENDKTQFLIDANARLAVVQKAEADAAELEELRKAAAERAERDAAEAAKQAEIEAAAKAEREAKEAEERRAAEIKKAEEAAAAKALADAKAAEEAKEKAAEEARAAAAQAEDDRMAQIEADRKAEAEAAAQREDDLRKQLAAEQAQREADAIAAKEREEQAAQAERDRQAKEREAEAKARAKREADDNHRATIRADICAALETAGAPAKMALSLANMMLNGQVPHVTVNL